MYAWLKEKSHQLTFGGICSANNSYLDYLINSVARCSRVQLDNRVKSTRNRHKFDRPMGAAMTAASQMAFKPTVRYGNEAHRKLRRLCGEASRPPTLQLEPGPHQRPLKSHSHRYFRMGTILSSGFKFVPLQTIPNMYLR